LTNSCSWHSSLCPPLADVRQATQSVIGVLGMVGNIAMSMRLTTAGSIAMEASAPVAARALAAMGNVTTTTVAPCVRTHRAQQRLFTATSLTATALTVTALTVTAPTVTSLTVTSLRRRCTPTQRKPHTATLHRVTVRRASNVSAAVSAPPQAQHGTTASRMR